MFFTRKSSNSIVYPKQVILGGKNLPWVEKADHLGHVMHQSGVGQRWLMVLEPEDHLWENQVI